MPPSPGPHTPREQVVLLDEAGRAVGTADKATVHHEDTPLHLAFSCYVFDAQERVLVTRRALHKRTWPGEWTNSVCGHPAPGEPLVDAVRRRARQELGIGLSRPRLVLPAFRYRAVMPDGTVEHEMCPVHVARTTDDVRPDPDEVAEAEWVPWGRFRRDVLEGRRPISPWCAEQVALLPTDPLQAADADVTALPEAALRPTG